MKNQPTPIKAVILAGGSGTRLWPLSRMQLPKQFLRLQGDKTLLDATVHRLEPLIAKEDVLIVTGVEHAKGEAYNSLQHYQALLEPVGRNTAPAIALAAAWLLHQSRQSQRIRLDCDSRAQTQALPSSGGSNPTVCCGVNQ